VVSGSRREFLAWSSRLGAAALVGRSALGGCTGNEDGASGRPRQVRRNEHLELTIDSLPTVSNPFDPSQLDVWGEFTDPRGVTHRVPAFYFQGYTRSLVDGQQRLQPAREPVWKLRFAPTRTGIWTSRWSARTASEHVIAGPSERFVVSGGPGKGFLRRSVHDPRYLVHDDGSPYFAIGENVSWYGAPRTFDYDRWFTRLREHGANYARLWMPSWAFALEAPGSPLGDYTTRLDRAWELDYVFDLAQQSGISLMLCLQNHGPFSLAFNSEWAQNPYNAANGGPLTQPQEFFTNPTARELFKRRLRYCVARWGYAPQLLAWELWNEVDLTGGYDPVVVTAWHREMADYLRALDPNRHLVTTSMSFYPALARSPEVGELWNSAGVDLTQIHRYTTIANGIALGERDVSADLPELVDLMLTRHGLPTIVGEYGVNAENAEVTRALDPNGIALHDALWSTALAGAFGAAMSWWWDSYIDVSPEIFYPKFRALARFLDGVRWDRENFVATTAAASAPGTNLAVHGLDGVNARLIWIKNAAHQWHHADPSVIDAAFCDLGSDGRSWRGHWWNTATGAVIGEVLVGPNQESPIAVPRFAGDVALRLSA
jgi:hypothetical protein